jgi:hypothetical protein
MNIMNVIRKEAQAKFVPAAAVIRIVRVFNLMTRCKSNLGGLINIFKKTKEGYFGIKFILLN